MKRPSPVRLFFCALLFLLPWAPISGQADEPLLVLPPVALRGYGTVAGEYRALRLPGGDASVLRVTCADDDKARLLQAKYLSDLGLLPGVRKLELPSAGGRIVARQIDGQGVAAALRTHAQVFLCSAANATDLEQLVADRFHGTAPASEAEIEVPMYLDRWDQFGWRFYYRPNEYPFGMAREERKNYDLTTEFDWAQKLGRFGFVFWDMMCRVETAEGQMNDVWWDYLFDAARARKLPVAIIPAAEPGDSAVWLLNRYADQTQQKMPQFAGTYYKPGEESNGGWGALSWSATTATDVQMGLLQTAVKRFAAEPNVVSFLEPHGELGRTSDLWVDYGPVADAGFQGYLAKTYGGFAAVGERWFGDAQHFKSWSEVRVPELASFLGWSPQALDLTGPWRIGYESAPGGKDYTAEELRTIGDNVVPTDPAPAEWFTAGFDDRAWPEIVAPGSDRVFFLPKRPAVYRRRFEVPAGWNTSHPRTWLYVWDLNLASKDKMWAVLNGVKVGESKTSGKPHWAAFEVTAALKAGPNQLALRLPQGVLSYRVYLSPDSPEQYPHLGVQKNARWVDFSDWLRWSRVDTCRRGVEMIRQVDPDREITFMHPDEYSDGIKDLAEDFGGEFHNTGYASAFWADFNTLVMQGAGLPTSLETSAGAKTLASFKGVMGRHFTEGIQGVDYFIHIGDILWRDDIRQEFEAINPLVRLIGKYHAPPAETAVLFSTRATRLADYPWGRDPNANLRSGYFAFNLAAQIRDRYPRDGLTESAFANGDAAKYRVILDSNTSTMDAALVDGIERFVRAGGTFVTYAQSGRHTPEQPDAWPISRLTGYRVTHIGQFTGVNTLAKADWHRLKPAPGQSVYLPGNGVFAVQSQGLALEKVAPDTQDLLLWDDGTVAAGMRPLGKGWIVQLGPQFSSYTLPDQIIFGPRSPEALAPLAMLQALLEWRGVRQVPAQLSVEGTPAGPVMLRHWLSNNGLYDVWTLWNQDTKREVTTDLLFAKGTAPATCLDVGSGQTLAVVNGESGAQIPRLAFHPQQVRILLTPRSKLNVAALDWFKLQRSWWRGTRAPSAVPLPAPPHRFSLDLAQAWAWKPVDSDAEALALASPSLDDRSWERMPLRVWSLPDRQAVSHAIFRRAFTVPDAWRAGRIGLWIEGFAGSTFKDRGRIFLDGKILRGWHPDGITGMSIEDLKPGSTHLLAVEIQADGKLAGSTGPAWLWYEPAPLRSVDLAGDWAPSKDVLRYGPAVHLPGPYVGLSFRRRIHLTAEDAGKNAMLNLDATGSLAGALVNGHWVKGFHRYGDRWSLNITRWLRWGDDNEVELVGRFGTDKGKVNAVTIGLYDPAVYP